MVTYQIQLPESKRDAFLNIIRSLQSLGVVSSFSDSANVTHPGTALPVETLLDILKESEKQAAENHVVSANEVIEYIKSWRANR
jgi:serine protease inhibitor